MFDFSHYSRDSKFFDLANKKVISKMKDEFIGKIISESVGLKSKMYSLVYVDGKENKIAKGVNQSVVRGIRHKEFVDVLFGRKLMRHRMKRIQSKLHRTGTDVVVRFPYLVLMIKDTYWMIALIVCIIFIET